MSATSLWAVLAASPPCNPCYHLCNYDLMSVRRPPWLVHPWPPWFSRLWWAWLSTPGSAMSTGSWLQVSTRPFSCIP